MKHPSKLALEAYLLNPERSALGERNPARKMRQTAQRERKLGWA